MEDCCEFCGSEVFVKVFEGSKDFYGNFLEPSVVEISCLNKACPEEFLECFECIERLQVVACKEYVCINSSCSFYNSLIIEF